MSFWKLKWFCDSLQCSQLWSSPARTSPRTRTTGRSCRSPRLRRSRSRSVESWILVQLWPVAFRLGKYLIGNSFPKIRRNLRQRSGANSSFIEFKKNLARPESELSSYCLKSPFSFYLACRVVAVISLAIFEQRKMSGGRNGDSAEWLMHFE